MKRMPSKRVADRRKKPRQKKVPVLKPAEDVCQNCGRDLSGGQKALFVEEEVGRIFCSEACIASYFTPDIERLEKEFFRNLSSHDLSATEREQLSHLRWLTLQEPDEVWREKTLEGDYRFSLISEFQPGNKRIWCVCVCLFLRGEPSFLYLAFPTREPAMVGRYRRGERVQLTRSVVPEAQEGEQPTDRLADNWTEDETIRAQLIQERSEKDIPFEEFSLYQSCIEETLETPDEVWSLRVHHGEHKSLYHFIRHYPDEPPGVWYIIVARETDEDEQIEILDAFPTRDSSLVERYRRGKQEIGGEEDRPSARVIH